MRVIDNSLVRRLLTMDVCVRLVRSAFVSLAKGGALLPGRTIMSLPTGQGALGVMAGWLSDPEALGVKVIGIFPGNHKIGLESHLGVVLLLSPETGAVRALLDASSITAIRTAAASAVATEALARADAEVLAILGTGVQALSHLEAMITVRPIRAARIWGRTLSHAQSLVERGRGRLAELGHTIDLVVASSAEEAVRGADVICTVTGSPEPVLAGEWLSPGCHVNAVGAHTAHTREVDTRTILRATLVVDSAAGASREAGCLLIPQEEGAIARDRPIMELGAVLTQGHPARQSEEEITLFKSLGLAVQDLAAGAHVAAEAERLGLGLVLDGLE